MSKYKLFIPRPGKYLKDELIALNMTYDEFPHKTEINKKVLEDIINGKADIDTKTAEKLSDYFHNSSDFWMNLQKGYDMSLIQK